MRKLQRQVTHYHATSNCTLVTTVLTLCGVREYKLDCVYASSMKQRAACKDACPVCQVLCDMWLAYGPRAMEYGGLVQRAGKWRRRQKRLAHIKRMSAGQWKCFVRRFKPARMLVAEEKAKRKAEKKAEKFKQQQGVALCKDGSTRTKRRTRSKAKKQAVRGASS